MALTWASGGGSASGYRIAWLPGSSFPASCLDGNIIPESDISGTSHSVTGLQFETQYSIRICAVNSKGTPDVSSGVTIQGTTRTQEPLVQISGSDHHACALTSTGKAYCWGGNYHGALGNGNADSP
ncbi:fibronectin type III domain-containing protein, partial [Oligoflexus tunisiensis]|uniref:fibronectin type III domain-containing protein n=1 Tax=Oligoflexus tunisiensis TaxID=708132 RepID=UPI00350E5939